MIDMSSVLVTLRTQRGTSGSSVKNNIRELRQGAGLSQAALAKDLGVSRQTVNSIETGRYAPSLPLAITMARYFRRTVEEIFHVDE